MRRQTRPIETCDEGVFAGISDHDLLAGLHKIPAGLLAAGKSLTDAAMVQQIVRINSVAIRVDFAEHLASISRSAVSLYLHATVRRNTMFVVRP